MKVETVPGMSDHDAVSAQLDTTVKYVRKKPRKVYLYKKGNMKGLRDDMENYKESFLQSNPRIKMLKQIGLHSKKNFSNQWTSTFHRNNYLHGKTHHG
jgi:uncharacterized protein with von Willebrand factor type A (vWA) domain